MSQENLERLRAAYADADPLITYAERIAPDAEFDFTAVYPDQPVLRGVAALRDFRDRESPWETLSFEPERFIDVDEERTLVLVRVAARGLGSGTPVEVRAAHEFTVRDGLLCASRRTSIAPKRSGRPGWCRSARSAAEAALAAGRATVTRSMSSSP